MMARWLKFNAAGILGVSVQLVLLYLLTRFTRMNYLVATALAVEFTLVHNFLWHERYTWRIRTVHQPQAAIRRFVHFNLTNGTVSLGGNLLLMRLLVDQVELPLIAANVIAIAGCSTINFLIAEFFVFGAKPKENDGELFV